MPCQIPYPEKQSEHLSYPVLDENGGQGPLEIALTNEADTKLKSEDALKANANIDFVMRWCVLSPEAVEEIKPR